MRDLEPGDAPYTREAEFEPDYVPTLAPWRTRLTIALRIKFFLTGVVFPAACFVSVAVLDANPSIDSPWQSGDPEVYINLLMSRPTFLRFLPVLVFSMICLTVWCLDPRASRFFAIRFGLYTGALMAAIFSGLLLVTTALFSPLFAIMVSLSLAFVVWLVQIIIPRLYRFTIRHILILTTVTAVCLTVITIVPEITSAFPELLAVAGLVIIGASPTLALVTYSRASRAALFVNSERGNPARRGEVLIALLAWGTASWFTWKSALESMMIEYAKLPATDPNCFVSSAAAHGHRSFVGVAVPASGHRVNLQMKRLKFLEFALAAACPPVHRCVRRIYNRLGPQIAAVCRWNAWLSDAAFVTLKPLEYISIALQMFAGISNDRINEIYGGAGSAPTRITRDGYDVASTR